MKLTQADGSLPDSSDLMDGDGSNFFIALEQEYEVEEDEEG